MNWANQTIWTRDNLEIMRGMNSESVDLIYLDPPFNSKANYAAPIGSAAAGAAFKDTWTLNDVDVEWINLIEATNGALYRILLAAMTDSVKSYLVYMAVRLLEMRRILKPTGSIYLHCDSTMSHYLRLVMDCIFSGKQFKKEIIWKRNSSHNDSKTFGTVDDRLLFYGEKVNTDEIRVPLNPDYVEKFFRYKDARGRYRAHDLTAKGLRGGGYHYDFHGHVGPWRFPSSRMAELEQDGRIHYPKKTGGVPCLKRYLHENKGQVPSSIWTDISAVQGSSKEKTGYPTQKPIALLLRIIEASSDPGNMILDPFCGCATACIAAEDLQRQWTGIDVSPKAAELVQERMERELGLFCGTIHRTDIPQRTDLGKLWPANHPANKERLYGKQKGDCAGCKEHFKMHNLEVDHIIPKSKGGTDHVENLQLLCGRCNRMKGNRGMGYLQTKLQIFAKAHVETFRGADCWNTQPTFYSPDRQQKAAFRRGNGKLPSERPEAPAHAEAG